MEVSTVSFADLLKQARAAAGLTQEELAERANLSARAISDLERGIKHRPYPHTVQRLIQALELQGEAAAAFGRAARGQREETGAPAVSTAEETSLPPQLTSFVGRRQELEELRTLLTRKEVRLVTVTGPGGVGKTRVAIRAAEGLAPLFPDGAVFVSLVPVVDPELVGSAVATALGIREGSAEPILQTVTEQLGGKRLLLILDNFEHVLPAVPAVSRLLVACPQLEVLVTSRAVLHLAAEYEYPLAPLPVPISGHLPDLDALRRYDAVQLFIQRAEATKPGFALTEENAPAIAEVCSRLDGLPLTIELAAARTRMFTPQALLSKLSHRLQLLTRGPVDVPAKQQTLRGAIDWSFSLLSHGEQALFARLSVFEGGCRLEAAEAVCRVEGGTDLLDGVSSLVEQSLLQEDGKDEPRFSMLETIREYAREKLNERGEAQSTREAHARYYLDLVLAAEPELTGPHQGWWLGRLKDELPNIRAARSWLLEHDAGQEVLRLATALFYFWGLHGYWSEARGWVEEGLQTDGTLEPDLRSTALMALGSLMEWQGDHDLARTPLQEALGLFAEIGDRHGQIFALNMLGNVAASQSEYTEAISWYERTAALSREVGHERGTATALNNVGMLALDQGDIATALDRSKEAVSLFRSAGYTVGVVSGLIVHGMALVACGQVSQASAQFEESLRLAQGLGDRSGMADNLWGLGLVAIEQGDLAQARTRLRESLRTYRELGSKEFALYAMGAIAQLANRVGDVERSGQLLAAVAALRDRLGMPLKPREQADHDRKVETVRQALGEQDWSRVREQGQAMGLEAAITLALQVCR